MRRFGLAGRRIIPCFKAEERVFQSDMQIAGINSHRLAELYPGALGFAGLEQGIGEVLSDVRALRRKA
jgi:hypothetical protein